MKTSELIADMGQWIKSVLVTWQSYITGGVLVGVLLAYEKFQFGSISNRFWKYGIITAFIVACFVSWRKKLNRVREYERKPPSLTVEILEMYVQKLSEMPADERFRPLTNWDVFLHVKLVLNEPDRLLLDDYRLTATLYGNEFQVVWWTGDLGNYGLTTLTTKIKGESSLIAGYRVTELAKDVQRRNNPVEGWLHFKALRLIEDDMPKVIYRLYCSAGSWSTYAEITGDKNSLSTEKYFQKLPKEQTHGRGTNA